MSGPSTNDLELVYADSYRDGGSLSACFRKPDGSLFHVFLQVIWSHPPGERYRGLYLGNSEILPTEAELVARGSPEEAEIMRLLGAWLEVNGTADGANRVRQVLDRIPKIEG